MERESPAIYQIDFREENGSEKSLLIKRINPELERFPVMSSLWQTIVQALRFLSKMTFLLTSFKNVSRILPAINESSMQKLCKHQ